MNGFIKTKKITTISGDRALVVTYNSSDDGALTAMQNISGDNLSISNEPITMTI